MFIYLVTNKCNGKYYVGQTTRTLEERWYEHNLQSKDPSYNHHFYNAIKKYKVGNFKVELVSECLTQEELDTAEDFLIKILGSSLDSFGYNHRGGGSRGKHSLQGRKNMSKSAKQRIQNYTDEQKLAMTAPMRKRLVELLAQGFNPNEGRICSLVTRERLRVANTGKIQSEATCENKRRKMKNKVKSFIHLVHLQEAATMQWSGYTEEERAAHIKSLVDAWPPEKKEELSKKNKGVWDALPEEVKAARRAQAKENLRLASLKRWAKYREEQAKKANPPRLPPTEA